MIMQDAFRQVLERYNVFLSPGEFAQIIQVYASPDGYVDYKPFLEKVVTRQSSGAFGPHVAPKWQMSARMASSPRSPRSTAVRSAARDELFQSYYTPRAVKDVRRCERVTSKIGAIEFPVPAY